MLALGSCKWSDSKHEADELDKLETIAKMLNEESLLAGPAVPLLFFDRTGFSERLHDINAERDDVRLIMTSELEPTAA